MVLRAGMPTRPCAYLLGTGLCVHVGIQCFVDEDFAKAVEVFCFGSYE